MHRNQSVSTHKFAMVPAAEIPRSTFVVQTAHKTTFDGGYLIPVYCDEVLPGDTYNLKMTAFARLSTPLFPVMDNLHMDTFFFFVPNRLIWTDWQRFMGEQANPADPISYVVPVVTSPAGGFPILSLYDYMGLPTVGQVGGAATIAPCAFWTRAYNLIWNQWFRDENLQNSVTVDLGAGPDTYTNYVLKRRGKRHDYFTSCLPWPQKGGIAASIPLGTSAPVKLSATLGVPQFTRKTSDHTLFPNTGALYGLAGTAVLSELAANTATLIDPNSTMYADLSAATAATINQLRQSFAIQKLLERDARGGTRYTEIVRSHFGVISPDARLQRPEYLGGGSTPVNISPIAQTGQTGLTGGATPLGSLAGVGTAVAHNHGFTQSFTEHGVIIGMVSVRADLTYQQGMHKMWSRSTRYDFYFPTFAFLGEQAVLNKEIYCDGSVNDIAVFGYQEYAAEYRYKPSMITGLFRSTSAGTIDPWHLAQKFTALPTLNDTFIQDTPPISRVVAVGAGANGQQFIFDSFFNIVKARPIPLYSPPGMIDRF